MPWAEYATVNERHRVFGVELHRVPLELEALKQTILASTLPMREGLARQYA